MGRHLTTFLVSNELCSLVKVVDKVPPATAWLNAEHQVTSITLCIYLHSSPSPTQAVFQQVDFKQANLAVPQSAERAFSEDGPFDYVFNLVAETKYGQSSDVS